MEKIKNYILLTSQGNGLLDKCKIAVIAPLHRIRDMSNCTCNMYIKNSLGLFFCKSWRDLGAYDFYREKDLNPYFYVKPGEVFIDVGANLGRYSLIVANRCEDCEVFAVEPDTNLFPMFEKNLKLNNVENKVKFVDKVAYYKKTKKKMFLNKENPAKNTIYKDEIMGDLKYKDVNMKGKKTVKKIGESFFETITLDELKEEASGRISLIKLDIQGAELDALNGAKDILSSDKPNIIFEAWDESFLNKIENFLGDFGYKVEGIDENNYLAYCE